MISRYKLNNQQLEKFQSNSVDIFEEILVHGFSHVFQDTQKINQAGKKKNVKLHILQFYCCRSNIEDVTLKNQLKWIDVYWGFCWNQCSRIIIEKKNQHLYL